MAQALYLFKAATISSTDTLESYRTGKTVPAGTNNLPPDIYRTEGTVSIQTIGLGIGQIDNAEPPVNGGKNGWPDPPIEAETEFAVTETQIFDFLQGAEISAGS